MLLLLDNSFQVINLNKNKLGYLKIHRRSISLVENRTLLSLSGRKLRKGNLKSKQINE